MKDKTKREEIIQLLKEKKEKDLISTRYHSIISYEIQTDDETDNEYELNVYKTSDEGYIWDIVLTNNFTGEETSVSQTELSEFARELFGGETPLLET